MLTMTDLFCGAGGSSSGAELVPGVRVRMAANHWPLAIETHNRNHPLTDHDCADISQTDPRRYPSTDILWASPSCTNHSQARGKRRVDTTPDLFGEVLPDEAAERSRATMWDVCRFTEAMQLRGRPYLAVVVENVVDVRQWMFYEPWKAALRVAGYCLHEVFMNSMHAQAAGMPAPQSRDRWYCVGHLTKTPCPDLDKWTRPQAWCPGCDRMVTAMKAWKKLDAPWGRYRAQYVWRCPNNTCRHAIVEPGWLPAAAAIDWTLRGTRIGDRAKPLASKTMARIEAGLRKYARPITLEAAGNTFERHPGVRTWPVDAPLTTQTLRAVTASSLPALSVPLRNNNTAKDVGQPLDTVTAAGNHHALVMRNNGSRGDGGEHCTSPDDVLRTITTKGHQSLVSWDHLVYDYNGPIRSVADALPTQTTVEGNALIAPDIDVQDCEFRMLEPHEIKAAMAFAPSYVLLGNRRERVRLAGNAVTPPAARDLIGALAEAITGEVGA